MAKLKYLSIFLFFAAGFISLNSEGIGTFILPFEAFLLVPLVELFLKPSASNLSKTQESLAKKDFFYDFLLYLVVPFQVGFLIWFCYSLDPENDSTLEIIGKTWSMGIACGVLGINVGHELGHRNTAAEKFMAKILLLTSLYTHFIIEHNRGHHKNVGTKEDPATARYGESIYFFIPRSIIMTWISAWKIEAQTLKNSGRSFFSIHNEMIRFQVLQIGLVLAIYFLFEWQTALLFLASALIGIFLLETVNYIEHYGLSRKQFANGKYERVRPAHSWNSNHPLGRLLLFELSRHSDHHYLASRPYQVLRHHDDSPQLPTGYPGMIALAYLSPLWFRVMHRRIEEFNRSNAATADVA